MKQIGKKIGKNKPKVLTMLDKLPKNHGEWLELVIKFTKRAIHDPVRKEEDYLRRQLSVLESELNQWHELKEWRTR